MYRVKTSFKCQRHDFFLSSPASFIPPINGKRLKTLVFLGSKNSSSVSFTSKWCPGMKGKGASSSRSSRPQRSPSLWLRTTTCFPPSLNRGLMWRAMSLPRKKLMVNLVETQTFVTLVGPTRQEFESEMKMRERTYILASGLTWPLMVNISLS